MKILYTHMCGYIYIIINISVILWELEKSRNNLKLKAVETF